MSAIEEQDRVGGFDLVGHRERASPGDGEGDRRERIHHVELIGHGLPPRDDPNPLPLPYDVPPRAGVFGFELLPVGNVGNTSPIRTRSGARGDLGRASEDEWKIIRIFRPGLKRSKLEEFEGDFWFPKRSPRALLEILGPFRTDYGSLARVLL
jgi:hypothetical protein